MEDEGQNLDTLMGLGADNTSDQDLDGLGRRIGVQFNPQQKAAIKRWHGNKSVQNTQSAFLQTIASKAQRYLVSKAHVLDEQIKRDIASGSVRFMMRDYYFRRALTLSTSASVIELLKQSDIIDYGYQNLDKNYLPIGENMVVDKIKLSYGAHASLTAVEQIMFTNAVNSSSGWAAPIPAMTDGGDTPIASASALQLAPANPFIEPIFLNGEIELKIDSKPVFKMPIKRFFRDQSSTSNEVEGGSDTLHLETPILIKEQQPIQITIYTARTGNTLNSSYSHWFCEARLMGIATAPR